MSRNTDPSDGTLDRLRTAWRQLPVLPVLRHDDATEAVATAERLVGAGLGVVELTATTPDWADAVRLVRREHADVLVGLGTVRDPATARRAQDAGADFLVSPHLAPDVRDAVTLPLIQGGWTPTELASAPRGEIVKLFPAHVGGPAYLRSLRAVLPDLEIVPTGGIEPEQAGDWLAAGALAVGLGSSLASVVADPARLTDWVASLRERVAP